MSSKDNISLGLPKRLYQGGQEPNPTKSINYRSKLELIFPLKEFLGGELWEYVKQSPLGVVAKFSELNFGWSSRLIHHLVTRQLATKKKYELWFLLRGKPLRFTLREYGEVTGLNCEAMAEEEQDGGNECDFLRKLNMSGNRVSPTLFDLQMAFSSGAITSREDKLRVAYLVIVGSVILGFDRRTTLPIELSKRVIDVEKFEAYPWGREGFKALADAVKNTNLIDRNSYVMGGFLQVLQIWGYMVVPKLGEDVGLKFRNDGPPLLRYKGVKGKGNIGEEFEVENSNLGVDVPEWEDEEDDVHVDNLVAYYKEHKTFADVTWLPDGQLSPDTATPPATVKKRKGKEHVGEVSGTVKHRKVGANEEDGEIFQRLKTLIEEKVVMLTATMEAAIATVMGRVSKVEADVKKLIAAGSGISDQVVVTESPRRVTPKEKSKKTPPPKEAARKVVKKKKNESSKKASQQDEKSDEPVGRRITRSQFQVLRITQ